ncbi:MAG: ABC transporter ATP-binding protein [Nitrospirota bacterium]
MIEVENIGKSFRTYSSQWHRFRGWFGAGPRRYADHWVLRNVSFAVGASESIGILGRNGAGKSTLLKLIVGTLAPSEGHVKVGGRISAILELGMGFNAEFTARQNVLYGCGLLGYNRDEIESAMPEIERFADIGEYFDQPLRTSSSGMQMRVAFAAATAFRPDVLIVDEALSVGDLFFQAKCFERIGEMKASGTTLLYVSHAAGDIAKHCERALFIKEGRLLMDGPAREVSNVYLDDLFGKSAPHQRTVRSAQAANETRFAADNVERFHTRPFYRKDEHRWGVGGGRVLDFLVEVDGEAFPSAIYSHQRMRVSFKVHSEQELAKPIYGLLIKTIEGIYVYGTNSKFAQPGVTPSSVPAGDNRVVSFEFPMMLNTGAYLISLGVSNEDDSGQVVPIDRRYDSVLITVTNGQQGSGLVDLAAQFECHKAA